MRAKASHGYERSFLDACREELTYSSEHLERWAVIVAEFDGAIAGFYALGPGEGRAVELEALFVAPGFFGRGLGRLLIGHAIEEARRQGALQITIQSDPHAAPFYLAVGAQRVGTRESASIPGRYLPLLEIDLANV
ncbi:MAG: GNAT family N-acetyltransferase [Spirochaetales bacterium]|nr:GNAT family N-acetyltransferase [Spirochaetales bacterium]MCP5485169.1 GNAT family N-acetyltransferase [Spirochaetales bacterium]